MALASGTRVGIYEVTAKIGEGGMGEVYQARDTTLDRDVALKVLPEAFTADPDRLARFQREAKVLASLNHSNIGAIYGLEAAGETQALVLELIEGPTLADRIAEGPIPVDEALNIANQIAEALEAAHEQGIVHRDLKPANVKVKADGTVKVLDFGLAKAVSPDASGASATTSATMSLTASATQMGMVIGTAAYMAPEQARGKSVDQRADVWAFAVVLFEMLSGQRVFHGDDVSLTLAKVLEGQPKWDALPSSVPPRVANLLRRCLEKNPKQRMHAVGDVRLGLDGAFETPVERGANGATVSTTGVWRQPVPLALCGVALLGLGALVTWSVLGVNQSEPNSVVRFSVPVGPEQVFTSTGRHLVALSPDGTELIYQADGQLYRRRFDQLEATAIPGTSEGGGRSPFVSPDGEWIGFWAGGQLKKVAMSGGAAVNLCDVENPWGVSWGTGDTVLFGQGAAGIWQVPGTGGTPEVVITVESGEMAHGPQMLPDGDSVLFTLRPAGTSSWDGAQIVAQSLETSERVVLVEGGRDARYVETGHLVYALNGVLFSVVFDPGELEVHGGPVPLVENVDQTDLTGASHFALAANGTLVYVRGGGGIGGNRSLVWVDQRGDEELLMAPPAPYDSPRLSPDGRYIALEVEGENTDVIVYDLQRDTPTRLTFAAGRDGFPLWTPDGRRIVFSSDRGSGGVLTLFSKSADGTGQAEQLTASDVAMMPEAWADDGQTLVAQINRGDPGLQVIHVGTDGGDEELLNTEFVEVYSDVSPDGNWIAYMSDESGQFEVYARPFPDVDGGRWQISRAGGLAPRWAPDGRALYFFSENSTEMMVAAVETEPTFSPGNPESLFSLGGYRGPAPGRARPFDISSDGERFLMIKPTLMANESGDSSHIVVIENWFEELKDRVPLP